MDIKTRKRNGETTNPSGLRIWYGWHVNVGGDNNHMISFGKCSHGAPAEVRIITHFAMLVNMDQDSPLGSKHIVEVLGNIPCSRVNIGRRSVDGDLVRRSLVGIRRQKALQCTKGEIRTLHRNVPRN